MYYILKFISTELFQMLLIVLVKASFHKRYAGKYLLSQVQLLCCWRLQYQNTCSPLSNTFNHLVVTNVELLPSSFIHGDRGKKCQKLDTKIRLKHIRKRRKVQLTHHYGLPGHLPLTIEIPKLHEYLLFSWLCSFHGRRYLPPHH